MNNEPNKFLVPISIMAAGVMIAGAIYFGGSASSQQAVAGAGEGRQATIEVAEVTERDHIVGSRSAPIIVVEYSDLECPFCKVFHNTMKEVVRSYDGQVAWVYRHFPIAQLHSKAVTEAEATECAAEQGGNDGFWNYTDRLFELTNSNDSLDLAQLPSIAANVGLDVGAFNECLSSGRYTNFIGESVQSAIRAGAQGTPYSVILAGDQKVVINGAEPLASVKAKIDALLK